MENVALLSGILGIALSTFGLGGFAVREHRIEKRRTVSEMATRDKRTLLEFRIILWVCGSLIAVMMYSLVLPRLDWNVWLTGAYSVTFAGELLLSLIPAKANWLGRVHEILAFGMAGGMLVLAFGFTQFLSHGVALLEGAILAIMVILGILALKFWDHFLYYELPFIFMSHMSILIVALAIR